MSLTLQQLRFLQTPLARELLAEPLPDDPWRRISRLRKKCDAEQASAIAVICDLRKRAQSSGRFPDHLAEAILTTDLLLQQASSFRLAVYKGRKLGRMCPGSGTWDLCCGIGLDAIGLALAGLKVQGFDIDPTALLCARHNMEIAGLESRCEFHQADVRDLHLPPDAVVHFDPGRRSGSRRVQRLGDYQPDGSFLRELASKTGRGMVKLSPALDLEELPAGGYSELEYVSEGSICKQLLAWWQSSPSGRLATTATVLTGPMDDPAAESIDARQVVSVNVRPPGRYVIEPDPAVIAAGACEALAEEFGLWFLVPGLVWLSGDHPLETRLATSFEILDVVPGRKRDVKRSLAALDAGTVEIKTRGVKLDTDKLQKQLSGKGSRRLTVLWCRLREHQRAFIAERHTLADQTPAR
jgi:hypothetical protein